MDFNNKQLVIIFISIIMVTSVIGFAFWMTPDDEQQQNQTQPSDNKQTTLPNLEYTAGVTVTVHKLLPVVRLIAFTDEPNISVLDKALVSLDSIMNVKSSFEKDAQTGSLVYIAEIILKSDAVDAASVVSEVQEKTVLKKVYATKKAILKLPSVVALFNADLNMSKKFSFQPPFSEGLIELKTIVGDELKAKLVTLLQGEKVIQSQAFELENISFTPVFFSTKAKTKIISLTPSLIFSGEIDYNGFSFDDLEKEIASAVLDNNSVRVESEPFSLDMTMRILLKSIEEKSMDKNSFIDYFNLYPLTKILISHEFSEDNNMLIMKAEFPNNEDYWPFVSSMTDFISKKGFVSGEDFAFDSKKVYLKGELTINDVANINDSANQLVTVLIARGIFLPVKHVVMVLLLEPLKVTVEEKKATEETFNFDQNFYALLAKQHAVEEELELAVNFYTQRNKVTAAEGIEEIDATEELKKIFTGEE